MNTKMRVTGSWMVAGLLTMCMVEKNVWAQEDVEVGGGVSDKKHVSPAVPPVKIELSASLVFFPKALIEALARKPGSPSEEDLVKAWREGKGRLVVSHRMLGKPGQEVSARGVLEHIYPSEFSLRAGEVPKTTKVAKKPEIKSTPDVVGKIIQSVDTEKKGEATTGAYWAVEPQNLTMREIGFLTTATLDSCASPSQPIRIKAELEYVVRENDHEVGAVQTGTNEPPIKMVQPEFHSMAMKVSRECSDGRTIVQGGMVSSDDKEKGYFFITPRIVNLSKTAQAKGVEKEIRQVETQQLLVSFPRALIAAMAKGEDAAAPSEEQIIKAWRDGQGRLVSSDLSVSLSGQKVSAKGALEHSYPSEYNMVGLILRNGDLLWGVNPQNFTMREIGFSSSFTMCINDGSGAINMGMDSVFASRCADHRIDAALSTGGKLQMVSQPEVYSQHVDIGGVIQSGQTVVAGGMLTSDGEERGYFLITPKIAKKQE
jgi:hypothetical protein